MNLRISNTNLDEILFLRTLFLQENNFQIRYNACHERDWTDSYIIYIDNLKVGYGSIKGMQELSDRDTIFEFYIIPIFRKYSNKIFKKLIDESGAVFIECQSNDKILFSLQSEFAKDIYTDYILFEDHVITELEIPEAIFRKIGNNETIFTQDSIEYILALDGEVIATGGFLLHYNIPFADLYMEVNRNYFRKGFGSYILQEIKKECYLAGRVPSARCNVKNKASKPTLVKAGMKVCGFMMIGKVK